jgi:dTDP-glucose pyrophosphorylase
VKAVVLAAGLGTRMRQPDGEAVLDAAQAAAADRGWKAMMPIGGRPFLDYVLSDLADAGVGEAVVVVGPSTTREIRDHYAASPPRRLRLEFREQAVPRGSGDALLAAEDLAGDGEFLALNSDNRYPASAYRGLVELGRPGLPVFESRELVEKSNFTESRIAGFAVLRVSADGTLEGIVERPGPSAEAGGSLLSMNLWRFAPAIFESCRRVAPSPRRERELPRAVGDAIARAGMLLATFRCDDGVLDLSTRRDVAEVERRLRGVEARP